jgi:hypothetical protein
LGCIFSNGVAIQQPLVRVATQPDFLFSAGNDTLGTGTTNWIDNAASPGFAAILIRSEPEE